jgi:hypothetical protein
MTEQGNGFVLPAGEDEAVLGGTDNQSTDGEQLLGVSSSPRFNPGASNLRDTATISTAWSS